MESTMPNDPATPITLQIPRPETQSRLTNFPIVGSIIRLVLLIPHYFALWLIGLVAGIITFIAPFAILFTGNYPKGLFNFVVGYMRWTTNVNAYALHLRDEYPPFSMDFGKYAVDFDVAYPAGLNRLLNFPFFGMYIKLLLLLPSLIVLSVLFFGVFIVTLLAQFAILFTGSYPADLHRFATGSVRWSQRANAYMYHMTDRYPPFSLS